MLLPGQPGDWAGRGWLPIGYNSTTGYDPAGVEGPTSVLTLPLMDEPARTVTVGAWSDAAVGDDFPSTRFAFGEGAVWVANSVDGSVSRIDAARR